MVRVRHHLLPLLHELLLGFCHFLLIQLQLVSQHLILLPHGLLRLQVNPLLLPQIEYQLHHVVYGFVVALCRLDLQFVREDCTPIHLCELLGNRLGVCDYRLQYFDSVSALSVLNLEMELLVFELIDLSLVRFNLTPQIPVGLHERLHHLD